MNDIDRTEEIHVFEQIEYVHIFSRKEKNYEIHFATTPKRN